MSHFPESLLTYLYNRAEHGILILNPTVLYSNAAAVEIFGFEPVGKSIGELFGSDFMFITPPGTNSFDFTFDILINNEWYKTTSHTEDGQTVMLLYRENDGITTAGETARGCSDIYASMRGSASVISLIADTLQKSNPENADMISQIQHNCCQLSKDIGMLATLGSEPDGGESCRFDSLLSRVCSESNPLISGLGAVLCLSKPLCEVYIKMSPSDAERLIYSIISISVSIIRSQKDEGTKAIELSLKKAAESVILQINVKCGSSASEFIMLSSFNTDIPNRPVYHRKNLEFIKKLAKKYGISIIIGRDGKCGCSFTVRFNPADADSHDVFMQYGDNAFKSNLTTALVGLSDILPNEAYIKI